MKQFSIHQKASIFGDAVFAADDGLITTFAVVAGSAGATLSPAIVLILGFANLFADGLSMATGRYLGVKSELDYEKAEEKHIEAHSSPVKTAIVTYFAFIIAGFVPLIPYIFGIRKSFLLSAALVALALFVVGGFRSYFTKKKWLTSGFEMLIVGGLAACVAYLVGYFVENFVIRG